MSETPLYDAFSGDYDRFVGWEGRLAYDLPFLVEELGRAGARRVLDVACGTGWHTISLSQRGYEVVGADISTRMIEHARENAAREGAPVRFVQAGFGQLAGQVDKGFDGLICMGNSLPHVPDAEALRETLVDFAAVLRAGGVLITQQRNFDQVWSEHQRFMPLQTRDEGNKEWLFFRFYDFGEETIIFNMVTLKREGREWEYQVQATELWPILQDHLVEQLEAIGFSEITCYGNLRRSPFAPEQSGNLVVVARKGA
jgi:glycine/sarcosine N-methyltransferase